MHYKLYGPIKIKTDWRKQFFFFKQINTKNTPCPSVCIVLYFIANEKFS